MARTPVDRLSSLLERFRVHAHLFHAAPLCGVTHFAAQPGRGFLHVLRQALRAEAAGIGGGDGNGHERNRGRGEQMDSSHSTLPRVTSWRLTS